MLRKRKEMGLVPDYRIEDATRLGLPDASFDYVLCKEAYHHFARPMLGLYEMLRVARKAVVLVEPNDKRRCALARLKFVLDRLRGRRRHFDDIHFETCGNYIFTVSRRELEKVGPGLQLPTVAFKGLNDIYLKSADPPSLLRSAAFRRMRFHILSRNLLCRLGLTDYSLLMAVIFKQTPSSRSKELFRSQNWQVVDLPRNPHLSPAETSGS